MGTTQSVVARLESGRRLPSIRTVERFARAVGGKLIVRMEPARVVPQTSGAKRKLRMPPGYVLTLGYAADNDVWPVTLPA